MSEMFKRGILLYGCKQIARDKYISSIALSGTKLAVEFSAADLSGLA